jgi:hypothetical protein
MLIHYLEGAILPPVKAKHVPGMVINNILSTIFTCGLNPDSMVKQKVNIMGNLIVCAFNHICCLRCGLKYRFCHKEPFDKLLLDSFFLKFVNHIFQKVVIVYLCLLKPFIQIILLFFKSIILLKGGTY